MRRIAGVILAGGQASRLAGEKPLATFAGGVLLDAVIRVVRPQVTCLALSIARRRADDFRRRYGSDFPFLFDPFEGDIGPLNGILAALEWLHSIGDSRWLATFPCDTPFLPPDLVQRLSASLETGVERPVAADDGRRLQGLIALWPVTCAQRLRAGIEAGTLRSIQSALKALDGRRCRFTDSDETFFNVNTPEDLEHAKAIATRRSTR